jgi:hypothetical protein
MRPGKFKPVAGGACLCLIILGESAEFVRLAYSCSIHRGICLDEPGSQPHVLENFGTQVSTPASSSG